MILLLVTGERTEIEHRAARGPPTTKMVEGCGSNLLNDTGLQKQLQVFGITHGKPSPFPGVSAVQPPSRIFSPEDLRKPDAMLKLAAGRGPIRVAPVHTTGHHISKTFSSSRKRRTSCHPPS
ncbi:hypothetical protein [Methanofollis formosanus]|uniref:hypothetical protein n=1 Tax=Methanofollis formosanus TaxID=299308 RepID=UPI001C7D9E9E|nr:hypothetical protein [Methanofollis formosanus]